MIEKKQPLRSLKHLTFVRQHPCSVMANGEYCNGTPVEAHHLTILKGERGIGQKVGDEWTIPLCFFHHNALHQQGEKSFWFTWDIDAVELATEFAGRSPDKLIKKGKE